MSQQGDNQEPLSKRQKRGDEEAAAEIIAFGGPMYDEATARKMLKEEVLLSAEDAEDDESIIGFDPDDAALDDYYYTAQTQFYLVEITPMIHFALWGNAKMCRYLISRGASTTKVDNMNYYCPMYAAAFSGHLDICKLLYENGAQNNIRRRATFNEYSTPLNVAAIHGYERVVRWLVLHGALCADNSSEVVEGKFIFGRASLGIVSHEKVVHSCDRLVEWAEEVTQSHSSLITFLGGALPPSPDQKQSRMLQCLSGHPGVRKHIGDFVGLEITKGKQLRILRSLKEQLPSFLKHERGSKFAVFPYAWERV